MKPVELAKDIFWIGAVDYNKRNFHGYSRSPRGTTYNSYLVRDEKNVVFDTVDNDYAGTMFCRLAKLIPLDKVDYIVVNHTEKDHAGALCQLVERCKPEKIITSTIGKRFMEAQFDTTGWPIEVVKTGDVINIGKRNIHFVETRMLHWPDSMVSYIPEDKLLISNDAFGQNIASSERFSDQYDRCVLEKAIKEYYYNIVLPFSPQVLKTLELVAAPEARHRNDRPRPRPHLARQGRLQVHPRHLPRPCRTEAEAARRHRLRLHVGLHRHHGLRHRLRP